jgi:hypothetical protein
MDTCKHDWHFVHGTSDLECRRCGEVSGPRTPEQVAESLLKFTTTGPWTTELPTYEVYIPPKPVGGWVIDPAASEGHGPCTMFTVYRKPTDEQVKNTEAMFGWKWKDLP